jgi:hypothetical protein
MSPPKLYSSASEFLFNTPLYSRLAVQQKQQLEELFLGSKFDGHCVECGRSTTYTYEPNWVEPSSYFRSFDGTTRFPMDLICARNTDHTIRFHIRINKYVIEKVGQYPSLADIANDESKTYRRVLKASDARELHTAIGLAAHGVGIGSYVYLRRIFEHLISRRFEEHKAEQGWDDADYAKRRMDEKIDLIKQYLPPFLVRNKKIYSILSLGIHELDDDDCRAFFPVLRQSIVTILEEDKQAAEKRQSEADLESAIAQFQPKGKQTPKEG